MKALTAAVSVAATASLLACGAEQAAEIAPTPTTDAPPAGDPTDEATTNLDNSGGDVKETAQDLTSTTTEPAVTVTSTPPQRPTTTVTLPPNSVARSTLPVDASLTPYNGWAIPEYIVGCETGWTFDWMAYNASSGASGPYQLMPFHLGGDARMFPREVQHRKAAELWAGGRGASHWAACL